MRLEDKWFWLTFRSLQKGKCRPLSWIRKNSRAKKCASGGTVLQRSQQIEFRNAGARMGDAKCVSQFHTTSDFSYRNRRLTGPRLLRVGDAAGFIDPIFSSGVYVAMYSGRLAARAIAGQPCRRRRRPPSIQAIRKEAFLFFAAMDLYWEMVEGFYTRPFMERFIEPRRKFQLPDAIVAILAGELEGGWKLDWRRRLFFWLVKLHARRPIVSPITFAERPS